MSVSFPSGGSPFERIRKLRADVVEGATEAVITVCLAAKRDAQQALTDLGKVDRGILRDSIDFRVTVDKNEVKGVVFASAAHAQWVNFGRRGLKSSPPGMVAQSATAAWPPVAAIRAWVARHFDKFAPLGITKGGRARRSKKAGQEAKAVDRLAFVIGRHIYWYGIKRTPFLTAAFSKWSKQLPKLVQQAVLRRRAQS